MRASLVLFALAGSASALAGAGLAQQHKSAAKTEAAQTASKNSELPITRVALYKNGVGFFEHAGRVTGDQPVTIDFTSAQLNDVLQSLTAIDLNGGRISGAGYNSTTPLEQQLKSMPLALSADPSDVDFYNAIRGARVQVSGIGSGITGRLLSIDLRTPPQKDGEQAGTEHRFLTVVSDAGQVRTVELTPAVSVTLLDTALHTDVTRYLELLASTRNQGLRHLTLLDRAPEGRGTGPRELRVSYVSEVPVWKSTYRILFSLTPAGANTDATLLGWSVIDNTTGSDWTNVHLDLIAGAPQSFIQPLSTPYYARRPEIPLPAEAQLTPQTHESGDEAVDKVAATPAPSAGVAGMEGISSANETVAVNGRNFDQRLALQARMKTGGTLGGVMGGMGPGSGGNTGGGVAYQQWVADSNAPQATASAFDDFFEYSLTDPITIRKNESALVPILQTKVPAERVTLWSPSQPVPLRALWITNSSNLTLDRGSFSIVENGSFGGEGLLDPVHPGEKRLLSYAADQAVRISTDYLDNTRKVLHLAIKKGVMTETSTDLAEVKYQVHNAAPEPRMVIVEQPLRQGWTLDSDPKPAETTPTAYRFRVAIESRKSASLHISERHTDYEYIKLVDRSVEQIMLLIQNAKASPAVLAALQPVFDLHGQVVVMDAQIKAREAEVAEITKDQDRLRENMKALKGSAEERSLLQRYTGELNAQEDKLAALRNELTSLHAQRTAKDAEFQAKLDGVEVDEAL